MAEQEKNNHAPAAVRTSLQRRFLSFPTLISFAVAALLLYFVLGRLNLDITTLGRLLRESQPLYILLALVIYYSTFPLRGLRWRLLLLSSSRSEPDMAIPSYWRLGGLVLLGWFGNCISWVRLGDAYRGYLVTEHSRVGFSRAMGTIVAERAFDVPVIFTLLVASVVVLWGVHPGSSVVSFIWVGLALISILLVGLLLMRVLRNSLRRRLPTRLRDVYTRFEEGVVGGARAVPLAAPLTVAIWLIEATSLYLITRALGEQAHVTFAFALFAYLGSSLLMSIPLTPGGLGIVEVGMTGLLTLKMSQEAALSATLLVRAITYGSILVSGGILFAIYQLRWRPAVSASPSATSLSTGPS